jgi:hypothetical protein
MVSPDNTIENCECVEGYTYTSNMCQIVCPEGYERITPETCQYILTCEE